MKIPSLTNTEANLRLCLLLKADDLYFTLAEPHGETLRNDFLGVAVEGLADENLDENEIASINLDRFAIWQRVRLLHEMLDGRRLSLVHDHRPDVEFGRSDALEFVEHFLSTLPDVALGGMDLTAARNGAVRQVYSLAYAWLNLIETIEATFCGETQSVLAVNDLALLSGLDTRTLRNRCGPGKLIRTSSTRVAQSRGGASPAFVSLNALDAVDWLKGRNAFKISQIESAWIAQRLCNASSTNASRGLLIASIINLGTMSELGRFHDFSAEQAREWFDQGSAMPNAISAALTKRLQITS